MEGHNLPIFDTQTDALDGMDGTIINFQILDFQHYDTSSPK